MTPEELKRAKAGDLIFLPQGLAERCSNCKYLKESYCDHPRMELQIKDPPNMCCGYWDNDQIDRAKELSASDNATFDVHQTDPRRLKKEVKKDLGVDGICSQCDIGAHERCRGGSCTCWCKGRKKKK